MSSRLKIVTIGPFPPLRGGISDFHESLVIQLSKRNDVTVLDFKSLYPKIFFPGKSQYSLDKSIFNNIHTILKPLNFFSWLKGKSLIRKKNPDRLILSYWSFFFIPIYMFLLGSTKRGNRYVLFHNVISHENRIFEKFLLKLFIKKIDYCIVMNEYNEKLILQINSRAKIIKNFHPIYELPYSDSSSNIYKKDLNIEKKKTILFFGLIRQYKGLDLLINAIALSKDKLNDLKVLVVGENYQSLDRYHKIIRDCDIEDSFIFVNNFISKADIKKYFLSSDLVVLPYKSASQSGVLSLAYNFNRPVIITDVGGLSDYVSDNKSGFIVQPNSQDISNKINMFFEKNLFEEMSEFIKSDKKRFSWKSFEEKLDLYG
ncbi:MAG: glycosyltransferase [bacterium]|nr:glycosyltransferase [Candidatus Neomarinimicrobiota bacterium]HIL86923.1 glycosyltransferase [Candidatus Neomarinimicrobiota bacterium]